MRLAADGDAQPAVCGWPAWLMEVVQMDAKECAERLNTLAWSLDALAEDLAGKWDAKESYWKRGDLYLEVTKHIEELYGDADANECAQRIEFDLDAGPSRRKNFVKVLKRLHSEARAIEHGNPRDVFRWLRESRAAAAADFCGMLEETAEYLWEFYWKLDGEPGEETGKPPKPPKAGTDAAFILGLLKQGVAADAIVTRAHAKGLDNIDVRTVAAVKCRYKHLLTAKT